MFLSSQNSGNFLRKEPHIAYRGRSRSFEADLEADLEAAEADLEAAEATQGHPRPLQATNKPGIYETNLEEGLVTLNNLEEGLVTQNKKVPTKTYLFWIPQYLWSGIIIVLVPLTNSK